MAISNKKYFIAIILATLLLAKVVAYITCRSNKCCCSCYIVQCNGKGLRTIPPHIPSTARKIDLSNNPNITIPSDYFLQFNNLFVLTLTNCGLSGPVYLPNTTVEVALDENHFTVRTLTQMFSSKLQLLRRINLGNNNLQTSDIKTLLKTLANGLRQLNIDSNTFKELTKEDTRQFREMTKLEIEYCQLQRIGPNTFDDMRNLFELRFIGNNLSSLPDGLFQFNLRLWKLQLSDNQLKEFNSTKLGLRNILDLRLANNNISTFDIKNLQPNIVMLNDNKIKRLETSVLQNCTGLMTMAFSNNNISYISRNAFRGIKRISQLLLNNNNLSFLPDGLFKGMTIKSIFLQKNKLSTLKGVFNGINNHTATLTLTENDRLTVLNGSDFKSLPHGSKIYLNCQKLTRLTNLAELKANITCIPKAKEIFTVRYYEGFSFDGYKCTKLNQSFGYACSPCRRGHYSSKTNEYIHRRICVKCPPGSYYQDESASTECKICRPGRFVPPERSPGTSASDCQTCPEGTNTTIVAGTRACKCLYGYSRRYRFGTCRKCTSKGYDCSRDYQILSNGYWITWQGTKPETTNTMKYHGLSCEYAYEAFINNLDITDDTYDRATMHFVCQMPIPIKCPISRPCKGGIRPRCSTGYTGVLCAVCNRGYNFQFNQCTMCPKRVWAAIQFIGPIGVFGMFCLIMSLTDKIRIDNIKISIRRNKGTDHRTVADIMLSSLKILTGIYPVLISIIEALSNVQWPQNQMRAINILQYVQFQIIQLPLLRCINSEWNINAIDEFWIILIIIITIPLLALAYYSLKSLHIHYQCLSSSQAKRKRCTSKRNCITLVVLFLFLIYPLISRKIIEILPINCHSFCTAKRDSTCVHSMSFLRSDYSIPCPTIADHKATLITAYTLLIITVSAPLLLVILLWSHAPRQRSIGRIETATILDDYGHTVNNTSINDDTDNLLGEPTFPMMTSALRFTYENYHHRYWYWEVIEMIRKLLMTISVVLLVGHTKIGLACTIIIAMMFAILHANINPFKSKFETGAQYLSLILIPLNLAFGAVLQSQDTQTPNIITKDMDSISFSIFLIIINSILAVVIVSRLIVTFAMKCRSKVKLSM